MPASNLRRRGSSLRSAFALSVALVAFAGCNDNAFQVIEEITFDPSLGIDLSEFALLPSGVYIKDLVVGGGVTIVESTVVTVDYVGYLANGTSFGNGTFTFQLGAGNVIAGFELGVYQMNVGGERRIIIPPDLGYGEFEQDAIPAGSVLIFDVTAESTSEAPPPEDPQLVGSGS